MSEQWWGSFDLSDGDVRRWEFGSLCVWAKRSAREWQVAWRHDVVDKDDRRSFETVESFPDDAILHRYVFSVAPVAVEVVPLLSPRPIINRPVSPVHLPPGQRTIFYVGSPLWIRLEVGTEKIQILEAPTSPLPETWFGSDTIDGELCFADTTTARIEADDIPFRPFHAVTPISIKNDETTPLTFDRVIAPVPNLALYQGPAGRLWTTAVTMDRSPHHGSLAFSFGDGAPKEADGGGRIVSAREPLSGNVVHRALNAFFS